MPATKAMDSTRPGGGLVRRHRSNALYAAMRAADVKQQLTHDCRESPETGHCLAVCPAELASMRSRAPGCARRFAGSAAPGVRPPAGPSSARPLQAEPVARHQLSLQTRGAGQPDPWPTPRPLPAQFSELRLHASRAPTASLRDLRPWPAPPSLSKLGLYQGTWQLWCSVVIAASTPW